MTDQQELKNAFDSLEKSVETFVEILKTQDYDLDNVEESFDNITYELAERCGVVTEYPFGWRIHKAILWDVFKELVKSFVDNTDEFYEN